MCVSLQSGSQLFSTCLGVSSGQVIALCALLSETVCHLIGRHVGRCVIVSVFKWLVSMYKAQGSFLSNDPFSKICCVAVWICHLFVFKIGLSWNSLCIPGRDHRFEPPLPSLDLPFLIALCLLKGLITDSIQCLKWRNCNGLTLMRVGGGEIAFTVCPLSIQITCLRDLLVF